MRKRFLFNLIFATAWAAVSLAGCAGKIIAPEREKLRAPGNFAFDENAMAITFGKVDGAETYSASINKGGLPVKQFLDFTGERIELGYLDFGAYTAKVRANKTAEKDASNYSNFDFIAPAVNTELEALGTPALINKTGNSVSWHPVTGAAAYTVKIYDKLTSDIKLDENNVTAPPLDVSGLSFTVGREYVIEVTANAVPGQFLQSATGTGGFTASSLPVLPKPQSVIKTGNTVTWSEVAGATNGYGIIIFNNADAGDVKVKTNTISQTATSFTISSGVVFEAGVTYKINVCAREVYDVSQESDVGTTTFYVPYPNLSTPSGITVDADFSLVSWNAVGGAETYTLKIYRQGDASEVRLNDTKVTGASRSISGVSGFTADAVYVFEVTANAVTGAYVASSAGSATAAAPKYIVPRYPTDKKMDIILYHAPYSYGLKSQNDYNTMAALGINVIFPEVNSVNFTHNYIDALTQLDRAHAAGLKSVVHDWYINYSHQSTPAAFNAGVSANGLAPGSLPDHIDKYKSHPAFYAVDVRDEPSSAEFSNMKSLYDAFKTRLPADKFFVNLYAHYAGTSLGEGNVGIDYYGSSAMQKFRLHIDHFMDIVKPPVLSYDHYPLVRGNTLQAGQISGNLVSWPSTQQVTNAYLHDMEYVRRAAKTAGVPANNILLATAHAHYGGNSGVNTITEEEIRWQVACTLAYGYQMYGYYTYGDVYAEGDTLIDRDTGVPNANYYKVQHVTQEVRAWDNVYTAFNWQGTATVGTSNPSSLFANINGAIPAITSNGGITAVSGITGGMLAGMFTDGLGNKGFMFANATRPGAGTVSKATYTFGGYDALLIYGQTAPGTVEPVIEPLTGGKYEIVLAPGQGKFVIPIKLR